MIKPGKTTVWDTIWDTLVGQSAILKPLTCSERVLAFWPELVIGVVAKTATFSVLSGFLVILGPKPRSF